MKYFTILLLSLACLNGFGQTPGCQPSYSMVDLDVNQVRARLAGAGTLWWDYSDAKYEVPKGSSVHALFAGGLWIGGIDQGGSLRMAAQTYSQTGTDFWAGPVTNGTTTATTCQNWDRHWKVNITDIQKQKDNLTTHGAAIPLGNIPVSVLEWPAKGNPYAKGKYNSAIQVNDDYAPFVDINSDGLYNPVHGDYPAIKGDQMVWWIFNDVGNAHTETGGEPLGVEVHVSAYAFYPSNTAMDYTTFYHYTFVNKSTETLDSVFAAQWVDVDLGYPFDDFVTYDSARNMIIGYNGDDNDGPNVISYGANPPAIAFKLLRGPHTQGQSSNIAFARSYESGFTAFGNPETADHFYYLMTGRLKNGEPWSNYGSSNYFFGFDTCGMTPFDRRYVVSTGPFTMAPGERNSMDFAMIWVRQGDLSGCTTDFWYLNTAAGVVQSTFDNYIAADAPDLPVGNGFNVRIHPNPAESNVVVQLPSGKSTVSLYGLNGELLYSLDAVDASIVIERNGLAAGVYILEVTHEGQKIRKKVVFR